MKESNLLILVLIITTIAILIMICIDGNDSIVIIESLDEPSNDSQGKYPQCPQGYILSGANCIPDGITISSQCDKLDTDLGNGVCKKETTVTCPVGTLLKTTYCVDPETKKQIPLSEATCPTGYTKDGPICSMVYDGKCPTNYKNIKMGNAPCKHEFESLQPYCETGYTLNNNKCFKIPQSTETFAKANEIESRAMASLYN